MKRIVDLTLTNLACLKKKFVGSARKKYLYEKRKPRLRMTKTRVSMEDCTRLEAPILSFSLSKS